MVRVGSLSLALHRLTSSIKLQDACLEIRLSYSVLKANDSVFESERR
jgi:hypothetical protein